MKTKRKPEIPEKIPYRTLNTADFAWEVSQRIFDLEDKVNQILGYLKDKEGKK